MASLETIGKAQLYGAALQKITGQAPSYIYNDDHVRVYFDADKLKLVQQQINSMATSGPSDVRVDWLQIFTPMIIKKAAPVAIGLLVAGYLFGRLK
jgi:hypothetical protein